MIQALRQRVRSRGSLYGILLQEFGISNCFEYFVFFFFFKQKTAYEIGTGDWSSDVCSSDLAWQRDCSFHHFPCFVQVEAATKYS